MKKLAIFFAVIVILGLITGGILSIIGIDHFIPIVELTDESFTKVSETLTELPKSITVDVGRQDIKFEGSMDETVSFTYFTEESIVPLAHEMIDGNFKIFSQNKVVSGWVNYRCAAEKSMVVVRVPTEFHGKLTLISSSGDILMQVAGNYEAVTAETSSGDVTVKNATAGTVKAKSSSGSVVMAAIAAEMINMEASSGTLKATDITVSGKIAMKTSSGNVTLQESEGAEIFLKASSGDIKVATVTALEELMLDTTSGSIDLLDVTANTLKLEASSGEIDGIRIAVGVGGIVAKTSSGDISLRLKGSVFDYGLSVNTSSGRVQVDGKSQGKSYNTSGAVSVNATCSSGDIEITFW